jgi:hypothetical protein
MTIAAQKVEALERDRRAEELANSERELRANNDENLKQSGRLVEPPRPDLEAENALKNAQIAGRSIGPSDGEYAGR